MPMAHTLLALALLSSAAPTAAGASESATVRCRLHVLPVALAQGAPPTSWVLGELCAAGERPKTGAPLQVLLHGATYDHTYWNHGPVNGVDYSYARALAAAGIPTFAYDDVGAGFSAHPPSTLPAFAEPFSDAAYILHQVVDHARGGALEGTRFGKVITVGNSLGSLIAWAEADRFQDVDGVIATGMIHHLAPAVVQAITDNFQPARLDPAFSWTGLDDGYLTTRPGSRATIFYDTADGDADPRVIALDEEHKDVAHGGLIVGGLGQTVVRQANIDVPVLALIGAHDVFCDADYPCASSRAVAEAEAPHYGPKASVQACAVPRAAHSLALHIRGHAIAEAASIGWTRRILAGERPSGAAPGCSP